MSSLPNPISFTQGDTISIQLTATNNGVAIDLTGATLSSEINGPNAVGEIIFDNAHHTINPDQVNFAGQYTLNLAPSDTNQCGAGFNKEIITTVNLAGAITHVRGPHLLTVYPPDAYP